MSSFRIAVVFGAHAIASAAAFAQTPGRVRGTITAIDGNTLSVKSREGQDLKIVPDNIPIVMAVDGDRSLLVAGQYAYIAVTTDAGGKMTATRVQITKDGVKPPQ